MNMFEWQKMMDMIFSYPATQQLLLVVTLCSVLVMLAMWKAYRRQQKLQKAQMDTMRILQQDVKALVNAAVGVGEHVMLLERRQRELTAAQAKSQAQTPPAPQRMAQPQHRQEMPVQMSMSSRMPVPEYSDQPYEQAIRMVKNGADIRDVAKYCGLSRSEAELIAMMHRYDKNSQAIH